MSNFNTIAEYFGSMVRDVSHDPMSGHVVVTLKVQLKKRAA